MFAFYSYLFISSRTKIFQRYYCSKQLWLFTENSNWYCLQMFPWDVHITWGTEGLSQFSLAHDLESENSVIKQKAKKTEAYRDQGISFISNCIGSGLPYSGENDWIIQANVTNVYWNVLASVDPHPNICILMFRSRSQWIQLSPSFKTGLDIYLHTE